VSKSVCNTYKYSQFITKLAFLFYFTDESYCRLDYILVFKGTELKVIRVPNSDIKINKAYVIFKVKFISHVS